MLPHYLVKFKCSTVQRYIHTRMLYSVLAGLICTTSNVNPDNSRYFVRSVLKLAYLFY